MTPRGRGHHDPDLLDAGEHRGEGNEGQVAAGRDQAVCREGTYEIAVRAIKAALNRGFRVTTNSTLFNNLSREYFPGAILTPPLRSKILQLTPEIRKGFPGKRQRQF